MAPKLAAASRASEEDRAASGRTGPSLTKRLPLRRGWDWARFAPASPPRLARLRLRTRRVIQLRPPGHHIAAALRRRRYDGGEGGIRTHGTRKGTTVFETVPIDHSGTSPQARMTPPAGGGRSTG